MMDVLLAVIFLLYPIAEYNEKRSELGIDPVKENIYQSERDELGLDNVVKQSHVREWMDVLLQWSYRVDGEKYSISERNFLATI